MLPSSKPSSQKPSRTSILNSLISLYSYSTYLEIGVNDGRNFKNIKIKTKHGVDPYYSTTYRTSSNKFFSTLDSDITYDLIFIDGWHVEQQVDKDIVNSLLHLSPNGTIVVHDCNPMKKIHQKSEPVDDGATWNGTVWRSFAKLRCSREDLYMCVINADSGCGIIRRGHQKIYKMLPEDKLCWKFLNTHRKELLNLVSYEEFFNEENISGISSL